MKVVCPSCQAKFGVGEDLVRGKVVKFRCKKCGGAIRVDGTVMDAPAIDPASLSVTPPPLLLSDQLPPSIMPPGAGTERAGEGPVSVTTTMGSTEPSEGGEDEEEEAPLSVTSFAIPEPPALPRAPDSEQEEQAPLSVTAFARSEPPEPEPATRQKPAFHVPPPPAPSIRPSGAEPATPRKPVPSARPPAPSIKPSVRPPPPKASPLLSAEGDEEPPSSDHSPLSEITPPPLHLATSLNPPPLAKYDNTRTSRPAPQPKPAAPPPAKDSFGNRYGAWLAMIGMVALAVSIWVTFRPPAADDTQLGVEPPPAVPTAAPAAAPTAAPTAVPTALATVTSAAAAIDASVHSATSPGAAAAPAPTPYAAAPAARTGPAAENPYDEPAAAPKAAPAPAPAPAASQPALTAAMSKAVEPAAEEKKAADTPREEPKAAQAAPATPSEPEAEFDRQAAITALQNAAMLAASCKTPSSPAGLARLAVTFAPSGRVTSAVIEGPPFAGTPEGSCIASKFRAATIPPFSGGNVIVHRSFSL